MSLQRRLASFAQRVQNESHKLAWGVRVVGIWATLRGATRFVKTRLLRPKRSEIRIRSGVVLEFDYPQQFPPVLVMFGDLIDPEFAFLQLLFRPDWVVVDVGAAIGQFAIFAATRPCARVYTFEPNATNVATLRRNIVRNEVAERVDIFQFALSDKDGESTFEATDRTFMGRLSSDSSSGGEVVTVRRLDAEFKRLGVEHVNVLKINVAGHEPEVLAGAEPFLATGKADILILLLGLPSLPWYSRLAGHGYRFFYYNPKHRTLYEITAFDKSSVLDHRPWPARHIIAIHRSAIVAGIISSMRIQEL